MPRVTGLSTSVDQIGRRFPRKKNTVPGIGNLAPAPFAVGPDGARGILSRTRGGGQGFAGRCVPVQACGPAGLAVCGPTCQHPPTKPARRLT